MGGNYFFGNWLSFSFSYRVRHFQELNHELLIRLNRSHRFANHYMNQFFSPLTKVGRLNKKKKQNRSLSGSRAKRQNDSLYRSRLPCGIVRLG